MPPSDVEAARVRARRRLVGMAVLVGAGVVGFPWLFETEPRPMSQDIELVQSGALHGAADGGLAVARSASRAQGKVAVAGIVPPPRDPEGDAVARERAKPALESPVEKAEPRESVSSLPPQTSAAKDGWEPPRSAAKAQPPAPRQDAPTEARKEPPKPATKEPAKAAAKPAEKQPSGKSTDKATDKAASRYVVQFGAFADAAAARAARAKVERLGIKTYAQQVDTPGGQRIRVRMGPYADKAEAEKALATLRKAGLNGAVLTL